jgi:Na+-transporting methylmalonyl-CoA/oxaloacetate decarboxylase gamma subunit
MRKFLLTCIVTLICLPAFGQGVLNVRINEVLVENRENIIDGYGNHGAWIELFNSGYESVNIGSCYLAVRFADRFDENGNKLIKKYFIPNADPATSMSSLEYKLFFCEGTDTKGTFYTNFTLSEGKVDMVILYTSNGKDIISIFRLPDDYVPVPDVSWGLIGHEEPESFIFPQVSLKEKNEWKEAGIAHLDDYYLDQLASRHKYQPRALQRATPGATNETMAEVPRDEVFRRNDPVGFVMTVIAMGVVFIALVLIFLVLKFFGKLMVSRSTRKEAKSMGVSKQSVKTATVSSNAEEVAAIGLALKMFQEDLHIQESTVITINRVGRIYSPWSSKIHGITQIPEKKGNR